MVRTSGTSPVCLVHLVSLVYLAGLVQPNKQDKPNKRDRRDRPNEQNGRAGFFNRLLRSLILLETTGRTSLPWDSHLIGPAWEHILFEFRIQHLEFQEVGPKFLGNRGKGSLGLFHVDGDRFSFHRHIQVFFAQTPNTSPAASRFPWRR